MDGVGSGMQHVRPDPLDCVYEYIIIIKIHSSCEMEDFVETHLIYK